MNISDDTTLDEMIRSIPEDEPAPDESEAIEQARAEYARGEFIRHEDIDWN